MLKQLKIVGYGLLGGAVLFATEKLFIPQKLLAQAVVYDPANTAQASQNVAESVKNGALLKEIVSMQKNIEELYKNIDWVQDLSIIKDLDRTLETTVKMMSQFEALTKYMDKNNPEDQVKYNNIMNKFKLAEDDISKALSSTELTPAERLEIINRAIKSLQECSEAIIAVRKELAKPILENLDNMYSIYEVFEVDGFRDIHSPIN